MIPISDIIRCVECITETSIDHIVIVNRLRPNGKPFPFNSFLKLIEGYCERPIPALYLVHKEEFEDYKTNVFNELKEQYRTVAKYHHDYYKSQYKQRYATSNLHGCIEKLSQRIINKDIMLMEKDLEISRLQAGGYTVECLTKKLEVQETEINRGTRGLSQLKQDLLGYVKVDLRDKNCDPNEPILLNGAGRRGGTCPLSGPPRLGEADERDEDLAPGELPQLDENQSLGDFELVKKLLHSQEQCVAHSNIHPDSTHSISASPSNQTPSVSRTTDGAPTEAMASRNTPGGTAPVVNAVKRAMKSLSGGLDGTDERDNNYAKSRYPFQVDLLRGKSQALASGSPPSTMLPIKGTTPQGQNDCVEQESMLSKVLDAGLEDVRRTTSPHVQLGRAMGPSEPALTLEDLIAKWRPPVGREDNPNHGGGVLKETPRAVWPNRQSTRTTSPVLRYGLSNSPPAARLRTPPTPRHLASVDTTPASLRSKPLPRPSWASKEKPASREFAPGLAMRKPKVDPYDPPGLALPNQTFSMAADLTVPDVRGTWTTIDKDTNVRGFDKLWRTERNKDESVTTAGITGDFNIRGPEVTVAPSLSTTVRMLGGNRAFDENEELSHEKLDDRFENPDIDVDEDIRKKFLSIREVAIERPPPGSLREHRNPFLLKSASSAPMTVIIGGKVAKVLKPAADRRGEFQDRFGNYVGTNLGRMKKHLIEDRETKIRQRDEEMVEATKQKRAFDALGPEEREAALAKRQAPMGFITGGQGAASADIFEFSDIPEIYLNPMAESNPAQGNRPTPLPHQRVTGKASISMSSVRGKSDAPSSSREMSISNGSDFHPIEEFDDPCLTHKDARQLTPASRASNSTARATGANTVRIGTRKSRGRKIQATISSTDPSGTPSLLDEDPDLARLEDVEEMPGEFAPENSDAKADVWSNLHLSSSTRGRVVSVTLHDPVQFTPGAIMERIFGGIIQEVQFHPKERIALVVFVFPAEAEDFVKHVKAVKENDYQEYRRLQIDADWYKGSEHHAVYPLMYQIALRVIGEDARRVLGVNGIPLQKKKEDVNKELNIYLGKLMVKVGLMMSNKRYVRERGKIKNYSLKVFNKV